MNIEDPPTTGQRPTTDLRAHSHILGKFQMAITLQRVNLSTDHFTFGSRVGFSWTADRSNGAIFGWIKSKMAAGGHLGKLQMAIISGRPTV